MKNSTDLFFFPVEEKTDVGHAAYLFSVCAEGGLHDSCGCDRRGVPSLHPGDVPGSQGEGRWDLSLILLACDSFLKNQCYIYI